MTHVFRISWWAIFTLTFVGGAAYASSPPSEIRLFARTAPLGSFVIRTGLAGVKCRIEGDRLHLDDVRVELDSLESGLTLRDHIMKDKYFDTKRFPRAFLRKVRAEEGKFTGELSIRDRPSRVEGTYVMVTDGIEAHFLTRLSEFDIPEPRYLGVGVQDEVEVTVRSRECVRR